VQLGNAVDSTTLEVKGVKVLAAARHDNLQGRKKERSMMLRQP
jgi:hypothetical protein